MKNEELYDAFICVLDFALPECPRCHEKTLRNTAPFDPNLFGHEGEFNMWQKVECDNCGIYGGVCYRLDYENNDCSLNFTYDEEDGYEYDAICPECGHIIATEWAPYYHGDPDHVAHFEYLPEESSVDEVLVRWRCPQCGTEDIIKFHPIQFSASDDWIESQEEEE